MFKYKPEFNLFFLFLGTNLGALKFKDRMFLVRMYKKTFKCSLKKTELLKAALFLNSDVFKRFSFLFALLEISSLRSKILGTKN